MLIWHFMTQIIVARNFWFIFSYPSSSPSSSLLSLQILSFPLFILSYPPLLILYSLSSLFSSSTPFPPSPHPLLSFLPLLILYSPPFPFVSPFSQSWLNLKLHVSTVCYYHPLEFRSNLLVLEPPVFTSVSVVYMHLCIHPLFPRLVLVSHLKLVHIKSTSSQPSVLQMFRLIIHTLYEWV